MLQFKDKKTLIVTKEILNTGTDYNINGIDVVNSVFFWRKPKELYSEIPKGSYEILTVSNNTVLRIKDIEALKEIEKLQIATSFTDTTSSYVPSYKVDTEILKDRYNELVDNFKNLYRYVRETSLIGDGQDFSLVIPSLGVNEVWYMGTDGKIRGYNIQDVDQNIKDVIEKYREEVITDTNNFKNQFDKAIQNIENKRDSSLAEMQELSDNVLNTTSDAVTQIIDISNTKTNEIEAIASGNISDMTTLKNSYIEKITEEKDDALAEIVDKKNNSLTEIVNEKNSSVTEIENTGTAQNLLVLEQGNTQNTRLVAQGNTQNTRIIDTGNTQNTRITNTGDAQNTRILDQGDAQSNRLNSIDNQVSTKFDLMQRMMSVVVGANRWLDGGNIELRDISLSPERIADGGDVRKRIGNPRRIYDAGDITQRVVDIPLDIDLGTK